MRIEDTQVQQASRHHVEGHGKKDGLGAVKEHHEKRHHHDDDGGVHGCKRPDRVAISEEARSRFEAARHRTHEASTGELEIPAGLGKTGFLGALIRGILSGQDVNITDVARASANPAPAATQSPALADASAATAAPATEAAAGPQATVPAATATNSISASLEQLNFSATGTIKTNDGKEVGFTLSLNMAKASVSGFSAEAAAAGQGPMSVNFAGSSSELFSMSFEFTINPSEGAEPSEGTGLLAVDDDDAHEGGMVAPQTDTAISAADFLKALRKAEFTSTYLSFSKTTIEASSTIAIAEGAPIEAYQIPAPSTGSGVPLDLVA